MELVLTNAPLKKWLGALSSLLKNKKKND